LQRETITDMRGFLRVVCSNAIVLLVRCVLRLTTSRRYALLFFTNGLGVNRGRGEWA